MLIPSTELDLLISMSFIYSFTSSESSKSFSKESISSIPYTARKSGKRISIRSIISQAPGRQHVPTHGPADVTDTTPTAQPQPLKQHTVASNAQAIDSMGIQLYNMSQLLERISGKIGAGPEDIRPPQPIPHPAPPPPVLAAAPPAARPLPPPSLAAPTSNTPTFPQHNQFTLLLLVSTMYNLCLTSLRRHQFTLLMRHFNLSPLSKAYLRVGRKPSTP